MMFNIGDTVFFKRTKHNLFVVDVDFLSIYVYKNDYKNSHSIEYGINHSSTKLIRKSFLLTEKINIAFK